MSQASPRRFASTCEPFLSLATVVLVAILSASLAGAPAAQPANAPPDIPLKLPPDRVYAGSVGPDSAVTFRHATHVEFESNRCTGCHPKLYRILGPSPRNTHRDMDQGGSCGTCHDGKHAFDVRAKESCASCHAGRRAAKAGAPDSAGTAPAAFKGPSPFVYKQGSASPGVVTFRHETHRGKSLACNACHPKLFPMKAVPQDPNADWHEKARCGGCHDGKQSFGVEDDDACQKCHKEGSGAK